MNHHTMKQDHKAKITEKSYQRGFNYDLVGGCYASLTLSCTELMTKKKRDMHIIQNSHRSSRCPKYADTFKCTYCTELLNA